MSQPAAPTPTKSAVLVTGPTRGLGLATAEHLARHPARPALLLLGREGASLEDAAEACRAAGATDVHIVTMDQADLASIRAAASTVRELVRAESYDVVAIVANIGLQVTDLHQRTHDGFELTFGVNVLGTHLVLRELAGTITTGGRMVLVGSGTAEDRRRDGLVPVPVWEDPLVLAQPHRGPDADSIRAGRQAYSTSKLGTLYLAHAHARRATANQTVDVFDPGLMPGTGLARDASLGQRIAWHLMRPLARLAPGMSTPQRSGRTLARMAMGDLGASGGRYLHIDHDVDPSPTAFDTQREERLWVVAEELTSSGG